MNMQDVTIQDRFNRAVKELSKLVSSEDKDRLAFSSDNTYEDLRRIVNDRILANKDMLALPVIQLLPPAFPILPGGGAMPMMPTGPHFPT